MTMIVALFGLFIAAACVWGIVAPRQMIAKIMKLWEGPSGLWLAIGVRVVIGVLFILIAPETRYPVFFQVLGYLMLIAAVAIPIIGKEKLTRFIHWITDFPLIALRVWLVLGFAFGVFIIYSVW